MGEDAGAARAMEKIDAQRPTEDEHRGEDGENESSGGEGAAEDDEMEDDDGAQDEEGIHEMKDVGGNTDGESN